MKKIKKLQFCEKGHRYFKTENCFICPKCEIKRKPKNGFFENLSMPAIRALEREGITTLLKLSKFSEKELLKLHGFGHKSIPILQKALTKNKLSFKK